MGSPDGKGFSLQRVVVEGIVIVGSILLAFGIDAWWDTRQENQAALRTIAGLEAAFSENVVGIEEHLETLDDLSGRVEMFLMAEPERLSRLPEDSAHFMLIAVQRQGTASLNNEYLTELVDAADLSAHPEIEAAVADWRRSAFLLRERREVLVAQAEGLLLEAGRNPELVSHLAEIELPHRDAAGLAQLRANPAAVSLATVKMHNWMLYAGYFRAMQEASESLVEMLRAVRSR